MKRKKEDYFVIGLGVVLVIIIFAIAFIVTSNNKQQLGQTPLLSPTPTISRPTLAPNSNPPVLYDDDAQNKLIDYVQNRRPLSDTDRIAKAKLLAILPKENTSGVLYRTKNIQIDYTNSADLFQVEILTTNVQNAKNEANVWLRTQGLSQDGICNLPIGFYLNYDIASQMRETGYVFNPLGNGC